MSAPPKVVLTGATGYLGRYLRRTLHDGSLEPVTAGRSGCDLIVDLELPETMTATIEAAQPDRVLHTAALASIAQCEDAPELANRCNHEATAQLAARFGSGLTFVSTDLVFDGTRAPYKTDAPTTPLSVYGQSKARAEQAVLEASGCVVRLPLLFGRSHDGRRGASDMVRYNQGPVSLFTNELRTPLHVADAAQLLLEIVSLPESERAGRIYHLAGPESLSRFELGQRLMRALPELESVELHPCESRDERRPLDVSLVPTIESGRALDQALSDC